MGRTKENKSAIIAELKQNLSDSQLAVVIDYQGLSVAEITDLRQRLIPKGAICKVTKNTFMRIAVEGDQNWEPMTEFLKVLPHFCSSKMILAARLRHTKTSKKPARRLNFAVA